MQNKGPMCDKELRPPPAFLRVAGPGEAKRPASDRIAGVEEAPLSAFLAKPDGDWGQK